MSTLTMATLSEGELWLLATIILGLTAAIAVGIYAWSQTRKPKKISSSR